jgi:hypothetical protein
MKSMKQWMAKGPVTEITVCWIEEGVSFACWAPRAGRVRLCRKSLFLEASSVTAQTYRASLATVSATDGKEDCRVRWLILKEAFPHAGSILEGEGETLSGLPDWIERCWQHLAVKEIPKRIISGMKAMEKELSAWPDYTQSGTGFCLQVGQRILFLGQGNGMAFHRISRKGLAGRSGQPFVSREWLLQTRLLFTNRTGAPLRRIHIPEGRECLLSWEGSEPFEIIPGLKPPAWVSTRNCDKEDGIIFLHLSLFRGLQDPNCWTAFAKLKKRRRAHDWDKHLRIGSCLLVGGWGFLLLGACRHTVIEAADGIVDKEIRSFRTEIQGYEQRWRSQRQGETLRKQPYRLIGTVADSTPEGVELNRIRIEKSRSGKSGTYELSVEGDFHGNEPTNEFRKWVELLKRETPLEKVENLRFDRDKECIRFSLQGMTSTGGG